MKKIALILTISLLTGMVFGCGSSETSDPAAKTAAPAAGNAASAGDSSESAKIKIGVVNQTLKEAVYRDMRDGALEKAKELGVMVEWQSCDLDAQKQVDIVNNYITRGFDVIVCEPVSPDASYAVADICGEAGIPLVDLEAVILTDNDAYKPKVHITGDFRAIGRGQIEEFLKDFGNGPANMVILCGTLGDSVAQDLNDGYQDILKDNSQINVIQQEWHPNWDRQLAMNTVQNVLARGEKVDVIIANNDGMGVGAVRAAEEVGLQKDILFYAMDHDQDAVVEILAGAKYKTVDKTSHLQGARCVEAAVTIARGEEVPYDEIIDGIPTWYTPFSFVSADALDIAKEKFPELFQ